MTSQVSFETKPTLNNEIIMIGPFNFSANLIAFQTLFVRTINWLTVRLLVVSFFETVGDIPRRKVGVIQYP